MNVILLCCISSQIYSNEKFSSSTVTFFLLVKCPKNVETKYRMGNDKVMNFDPNSLLDTLFMQNIRIIKEKLGHITIIIVVWVTQLQ